MNLADSFRAARWIRQINLFVIVLALVLMVGLQLFISRTRLGRAMRSTASDREAAQLMGVDINKTIALTFFIGSALAGAAGVVQCLYFGVTVFSIGNPLLPPRSLTVVHPGPSRQPLG